MRINMLRSSGFSDFVDTRARERGARRAGEVRGRLLLSKCTRVRTGCEAGERDSRRANLQQTLNLLPATPTLEHGLVPREVNARTVAML